MTTVAIIGAGPSGIAAAKAALECHLTPTVFEKGSTVGGLWKPNGGSVWQTMRTNLSYHSCAFSDMPWENPSHNFPLQSEVYAYLQRYAALNGIMPHIQFETEARSVSRSGDKWRVLWANKGAEARQEFDFVIVASGIFSKAYIPNIPGIETFTGPKLHSGEYRDPSIFKDKVVAVIGSSFSGTEIAGEVAAHAKKTLHIGPKAMWVLPRNLPCNGGTRPLDLLFYSRVSEESKKGAPQEARNEGVYNWFKNLTKQHEVAPLLAVTSPPSDPAFVAISDTYIDQVRASKIELVRSRLLAVEGNKLMLQDGREVTADAVVFATGYQCALPFLDGKTLQVIDYKPEDLLQPFLLHKSVFHPELPNMAFVGMYRGPYFATMELMARLAIHVFAKLVPQPTLELMQTGIAAERKTRELMPRPQFPHGNYVEFADELAASAGVLPDFAALLASDAALHTMLWKGPVIAAHYRLHGPNANPRVATQMIKVVNNP